MKEKSNTYSNEFNRMLQLSGMSAKVIKKILKEDEEPDDFLSNFEFDFSKLGGDLSVVSTGELTKEEKAFLVLNSIDKIKARQFGLNTEYNPRTPGAKPEAEGGTKGTIYTKQSIQKLPGTSGVLKSLGKNKMLPIAHGQDMEHSDLGGKWQVSRKNASAISYTKNSKISPKGKLQLEFLQRMLSKRPLPPNGNPNIDIEEILSGNLGQMSNMVIGNAELILRDFFKEAISPILTQVLQRGHRPGDMQFSLMIEGGIDKAIDKTKEGMYDQSFDNYGAWFIQVVKNYAIDELKKTTSMKLIPDIYDVLENTPHPTKIESKLSPDKASGNFDNVEDGLNGFVYVYNTTESAYNDFVNPEINSPLTFHNIKNPAKYYSSVQKTLPGELLQTTTSNSYDYVNIPAKEVMNSARNEVNSILNSIADEILQQGAQIGGRIVRDKNRTDVGRTLDVLFAGTNYVEGQPLEVVGTKGFKEQSLNEDRKQRTRPTYEVKVIDTATGEPKIVDVPAVLFKPENKVSSRMATMAQNNKALVLEVLYQLLSYGSIKPVYTKQVFLLNDVNNNWIIKNKGDNVAVDSDGNFIIPYFKEDANSKYDSSSIPMEYIWTSGKYSEETNRQIIKNIRESVAQKGIDYPSDFLQDPNKELTFINRIRQSLREYFGYYSADNIIQKNRDKLSKLIQNYSLEQNQGISQVAEGRIRKAIQKLLENKFIKQEAETKIPKKKMNETMTMEQFKKLISESVITILNEDMDLTMDNGGRVANNEAEEPALDVDTGTPETRHANSKYANTASILTKISFKLNEQEVAFLDGEIDKTLATGRVNPKLTYEKSAQARLENTSRFDYYTTALATIYKKGSQRDNIQKAMFIIFSPYIINTVEHGSGNDKLSTLARFVAKKAGIQQDLWSLKDIKTSFYADVIIDSIYEAIEYSLEKFDPERGGTFFPVLLYKAANNVKDGLDAAVNKIQFSGKKSSLDEPIGDEQDGDTGVDKLTGNEGDVPIDQKEGAKSFADALKTFIQAKLSQKEEHKKFLDVFNLLMDGNNLREITDKIFPMSAGPEEDKKAYGLVRAWKGRMEDFITAFIENGDFQKYVFRTTGIHVNFPNNKFRFKIQDENGKEEKSEPIEIYIETGEDANGQMTGYWKDITPNMSGGEKSTEDKLGDLVFGEPGENERLQQVPSHWEDREHGFVPEPDESDNLTEVKKFIENLIS